MTKPTYPEDVIVLKVHKLRETKNKRKDIVWSTIHKAGVRKMLCGLTGSDAHATHQCIFHKSIVYFKYYSTP